MYTYLIHMYYVYISRESPYQKMKDTYVYIFCICIRGKKDVYTKCIRCTRYMIQHVYTNVYIALDIAIHCTCTATYILYFVPVRMH